MAKEKILVINDDESIRDITKMILEAKGYTLSEAVNGKEGVAEALKFNPDLILLDIMMPEMNGFEACEKLKADPSTHDIPVLFFSSLTDPKDKIRGLELGAVDFINNIVDQGELLARVQTHLEIQALTRALKKSNHELTKKQQALDEDLCAAATIQKSFLPPPSTQINNLKAASFWQPMHPLGGDIFNIIPETDESIILYMIDVCGHDVPSALVTVSVSQHLHQYALSSAAVSPKEMMGALDDEYPLERFNRFFTIFYLVLNPKTGRFTYSCGGHPPAIILRKNGGIQELACEGTVIGLSKILPFGEAEGLLEPGDKLVLYTDGIIEANDKDGEQFGIPRFHALLEGLKNEPIDKIASIVYENLKEYSPSFQDDVSFLICELA